MPTMRRRGWSIVWGWWLAAAIGWPAVTAQAHGSVLDRIDKTTAELVRHPSDARLLAKRGALYALDDNWTQAAADFEQARWLDSTLPDIDLRLTRAWLQLGHANRVVALLDPFITAHPRNVDAHLVRARALVDLRRFRQAAVDFGWVIAHSAAPIPRTYRERAQALAAAGDVDAAVLSLKQGMVRLGPVVSLVEPAIQLQQRRGDHGAALALIDALPTVLKTTPQWRLRRGELLVKAGQPELARQAYRDALAAIAAAPAGKQHTPAMATVRGDIEAALERLPPVPDQLLQGPNQAAAHTSPWWIVGGLAMVVGAVAWVVRRGA